MTTRTWNNEICDHPSHEVEQTVVPAAWHYPGIGKYRCGEHQLGHADAIALVSPGSRYGIGDIGEVWPELAYDPISEAEYGKLGVHTDYVDLTTINDTMTRKVPIRRTFGPAELYQEEPSILPDHRPLKGRGRVTSEIDLPILSPRHVDADGNISVDLSGQAGLGWKESDPILNTHETDHLVRLDPSNPGQDHARCRCGNLATHRVQYIRELPPGPGGWRQWTPDGPPRWGCDQHPLKPRETPLHGQPSSGLEELIQKVSVATGDSPDLVRSQVEAARRSFEEASFGICDPIRASSGSAEAHKRLLELGAKEFTLELKPSRTMPIRHYLVTNFEIEGNPTCYACGDPATHGARTVRHLPEFDYSDGKDTWQTFDPISETQFGCDAHQVKPKCLDANGNELL